MEVGRTGKASEPMDWEDTVACLEGKDRQKRVSGLVNVQRWLQQEGDDGRSMLRVLNPLIGCVKDANDKVAIQALSVSMEWLKVKQKYRFPRGPEVDDLLAAVILRMGDTKGAVSEAAVDCALVLLKGLSGGPMGLSPVVDLLVEVGLQSRSWKVRERSLFVLIELFKGSEVHSSSAGQSPASILREALRLVEDPHHEVRQSAGALCTVLYMEYGRDVRETINRSLDQMGPPHAKTLLHHLRGMTPRRNSPLRTPQVDRVPVYPSASSSKYSGVRTEESHSLVLERDVLRELDDIEGILSDTRKAASWETRVDAMKRLSATAQTHYDDSPPAFLGVIRPICRGLAVQVGDLRSSVVREACTTIVTLAQIMGDAFGENVAEHVIPGLLKAVAVTIHVISESSAECLRSVLSVSRLNLRATSLIVDSASHRTGMPTRLAAAEAVGLLLENPRKQERERHADLYEQAINLGLNDPDPAVRVLSRSNFYAFEHDYPGRAAKLQSSLPPVAQRALAEDRDRNPLRQIQEHRWEANGKFHAIREVSHAPRTLQARRVRAADPDPSGFTAPIPHLPDHRAARVKQGDEPGDASHAGAARVSTVLDDVPTTRKPTRVAMKGQTKEAHAITGKEEKLSSAEILAILSKLDSSLDWRSRVDSLEVLERALDGGRATYPDTVLAERVLSCLEELLSATHFKIISGSLRAFHAALFFIPRLSLGDLLNKHWTLMLRIVVSYSDAKEPVRLAAQEALRSIRSRLGHEKEAALVLRVVHECVIGRTRFARSQSALVQAVRCLRDTLGAIEVDDFEWDLGFLDRALRSLTSLTRDTRRPEVRTLACSCLRNLSVAVPPGAIGVASQSLSAEDRDSIRKVIVLETENLDDFVAAGGSESEDDSVQFEDARTQFSDGKTEDDKEVPVGKDESTVHHAGDSVLEEDEVPEPPTGHVPIQAGEATCPEDEGYLAAIEPDGTHNESCLSLTDDPLASSASGTVDPIGSTIQDIQFIQLSLCEGEYLKTQGGVIAHSTVGDHLPEIESEFAKDERDLSVSLEEACLSETMQASQHPGDDKEGTRVPNRQSASARSSLEVLIVEGCAREGRASPSGHKSKGISSHLRDSPHEAIGPFAGDCQSTPSGEESKGIHLRDSPHEASGPFAEDTEQGGVPPNGLVSGDPAAEEATCRLTKELQEMLRLISAEEPLSPDSLRRFRRNLRDAEYDFDVDNVIHALLLCISSCSYPDALCELALRFLSECIIHLNSFDNVFERVLVVCGALPSDSRRRPSLRIRSEEVIMQLFASVDLGTAVGYAESLFRGLSPEVLKTSMVAFRWAVLQAKQEEKEPLLARICKILFEQMRSDIPEVRKDAVQTVSGLAVDMGESSLDPYISLLAPPMARLVAIYRDREWARRGAKLDHPATLSDVS